MIRLHKSIKIIGLLCLLATSLCRADVTSGDSVVAGDPPGVDNSAEGNPLDGVPDTQQQALKSKSITPDALTEPGPVGKKSDLDKAGIYPSGGKLLIDRNTVIKTVSITTSTVSSMTITYIEASTAVVKSSFTVRTTLDMTGNKITNLANGASSADAAAYGQVGLFQTVTATLTSSSGTAVTSFVPVGLSASITMSNSAHRIMITVSGGELRNSNTSAANSFVTVKRDSTDLGNGSAGFTGSGSGAAASIDMPCAFSYIDSPADTSAHTYAVFIRSSAGTVTTTFNVQSQKTSIILQEIL